MTREEAIAYFKRHIDLYCVTGICREAEEMAIQALEQEPCEDAVSRKALISHIENQSREWGEDYDAQQILGDIEDMPSVRPQQPCDVSDTNIGNMSEEPTDSESEDKE